MDRHRDPGPCGGSVGPWALWTWVPNGSRRGSWAPWLLDFIRMWPMGPYGAVWRGDPYVAI